MAPLIKDCNNCRHHVQGRVLDDCPTRCWNCVKVALDPLTKTPKTTLTHWEADYATVARKAPTIPMTDARPAPAPAYPKAPIPAETDPLKTQVGGTHYKGFKIQPVEFAIANKLDFFQKDVLKYLVRRKGDKAKRIEDLNKARHYIDMYIQAIEKGDIE